MPRDMLKEFEELETAYADLEKRCDDADEAIAAAEKEADDARAELEKKTTELEDLKKSVDTVKAERDAVINDRKTLKSLNDAEREYYGELIEKGDAEAKKKFLEAAKADRSRIVDDWKKNDATVIVDGRTIHKATVGEEQFNLLKSSVEKNEKTTKDLAEERQKREEAEIRKTVEDEFYSLPGDTPTKVKIFKAMKGLDEDVRKGIELIFKSAESSLQAGFRAIGHRGGVVGKDEGVGKTEPFMKRVSDIMAAEKCKRTEAMERARLRFPAEFAAFKEVN